MPLAAATATVMALVAVGVLGPSAPGAEATGSSIGGTGTVIYLNDAFTGSANTVFSVNRAANAPIYVGDWNGDGVDTVMVRNGARFSILDSNRSNSRVTEFTYGDASDTVLVGDWNGDGIDTIAVRRGSMFHIRNTNSSGVADTVVQYGEPGDAVLVGDWDGDGLDTLAVWRSPQFHIRNTLTSGVADVVIQYGDRNDDIVVGDWNGDGADTLGVVRGSVFHLRDSLSSGRADVVVGYGDAGDIRFVGDWNGDGRDTIGVRRTCLSQSGSTCTSPSQAALDVLAIANAHRAAAGLPAFIRHDGLGSIAQRWSQSQAASITMSHNPALNAQVRELGFLAWGENVAAGASSAGRVMDQWMNSPLHRAGILNPRYTHLGVGVAQGTDGRWYWTQNFGGA